MTPVLWMFLGMIATHLLWAGVFVAMWWRLTRSGTRTPEMTRADFETIRREIASRHARRN